MPEPTEAPRARWRLVVWPVLVLILALPWLGMQLTDEVQWGPVDFLVLGVVLAATGLGFERAFGASGRLAHRVGAALALATTAFLVITSLGVGIIGADGDPANAMYLLVAALGAVWAFAARFQPAGLARASLAVAAGVAVVLVIALVAQLGRPWSGPMELLTINGFFIVLFVLSAVCFRRAAQ